MDTSTAVRQRILELCAQREITVNRLATLSGVTQSTVNNIISVMQGALKRAMMNKFGKMLEK